MLLFYQSTNNFRDSLFFCQSVNVYTYSRSGRSSGKIAPAPRLGRRCAGLRSGRSSEGAEVGEE